MYDEAGIADDPSLPTGLTAKLSPATRIVARNLPRAMTSAAPLRPGESIETTALLRQVPLPIPIEEARGQA
jgi:hypothetical protein